MLALAPAPAPAAVLSGRVLAPDGQPVGDADFDVFDLFGNKLPDESNSDPDGTYELQLEPGTYDLYCQPPIASGFAPQALRRFTVGENSVLHWSLRPSVRLVGRITRPGGAGVAGVDLDFDRVDDGTRQPSLGNRTGPFGTFAAYLEPGLYRVSILPPESTDLAPHRVSSFDLGPGDTLNAALVPAVHLSATLRDDSGSEVAGARLVFERAADGARAPAWGNRTGADGRCRAGVEPGEYRVLVEPPQESRSPAKRIDGVVLLADATLDVTLDPGVWLSGSVLDRRGLPLAGADWDVATQVGGSSVPTPHDGTAPDGSFRIALPRGVYRLTLAPPPGSGLDTLVFREVSVLEDRAFDVNYSTLDRPSALVLFPRLNPAHGSTDFLLSTPDAGEVVVELFDTAGRRVRRLAAAPFVAGSHRIPWDGRNERGEIVHTGVFFARARGGGSTSVARLVLLPR